jgi:hypothetical protein
MPLNFKSEFHRFFFVAYFCWSIYVLFVAPWQQWHKADERYTAQLITCGIGAPNELNYCLKSMESLLKARDEWTLREYYLGRFWYIVVRLIPVPALVYVLCCGTGFLLVWLYRGFSPRTA